MATLKLGLSITKLPHFIQLILYVVNNELFNIKIFLLNEIFNNQKVFQNDKLAQLKRNFNKKDHMFHWFLIETISARKVFEKQAAVNQIEKKKILLVSFDLLNFRVIFSFISLYLTIYFSTGKLPTAEL